MNATFERIGKLITSMGAVIFALLLTIVGLLLFTHSLFYDALPPTIVGWERTGASWSLAFAWELTLLLTTCNTHLLDKRIPQVAAIASGIVVLFFFDAFNFDMSNVALRWFLGCLVVVINWIFTALFHKKWMEYQSLKEGHISSQAMEDKMTGLINDHDEAVRQLGEAKCDLQVLRAKHDKLEQLHIAEQESRTCQYCHKVLKSIYHLNSHKPSCEMNLRAKLNHTNVAGHELQ